MKHTDAAAYRNQDGSRYNTQTQRRRLRNLVKRNIIPNRSTGNQSACVDSKVVNRHGIHFRLTEQGGQGHERSISGIGCNSDSLQICPVKKQGQMDYICIIISKKNATGCPPPQL